MVQQPGVLYFVSAGSDCEACKSVKIGVTSRDRLLKRLTAIQSSNHTVIRLLSVIEFVTMKEAEGRKRELHTRFEGYARSRAPSATSGSGQRTL